jgi:hypothetical protein
MTETTPQAMASIQANEYGEWKEFARLFSRCRISPAEDAMPVI